MNDKRSIAWLILGCISMIKAAFVALQNRFETIVKEVSMTMNRRRRIFKQLSGKSAKTIITVAVLAVFFATPASAADALVESIGKLIDYNRVKIITIVMTIFTIRYIFGFYTAEGVNRQKAINDMIEGETYLVIGSFVLYNWRIIVNFFLGFLEGIGLI